MTFIELWLLAGLVFGEAGNCDAAAQIGVVHVWRNRQTAQIYGGWYGWQKPPLAVIWRTQQALWLADSTEAGVFMWSNADLYLPSVQRLLLDHKLVRTRSYACGLHIWRFDDQ